MNPLARVQMFLAERSHYADTSVLVWPEGVRGRISPGLSYGDLRALVAAVEAQEGGEQAWRDGNAVRLCSHDSRPGVGWRRVLVVDAPEKKR